MKGPFCTDHIRGLSVYSNELKPFLIYCHNRAKGSAQRLVRVRKAQDRRLDIGLPALSGTAPAAVEQGQAAKHKRHGVDDDREWDECDHVFAFSKTSSDPG